MVIPSTEKSFQSQSITSVERRGTAVLKEDGTRNGYLLFELFYSAANHQAECWEDMRAKSEVEGCKLIEQLSYDLIKL